MLQLDFLGNKTAQILFSQTYNGASCCEVPGSGISASRVRLEYGQSDLHTALTHSSPASHQALIWAAKNFSTGAFTFSMS